MMAYYKFKVLIQLNKKDYIGNSQMSMSIFVHTDSEKSAREFLNIILKDHTDLGVFPPHISGTFVCDKNTFIFEGMYTELPSIKLKYPDMHDEWHNFTHTNKIYNGMSLHINTPYTIRYWSGIDEVIKIKGDI